MEAVTRMVNGEGGDVLSSAAAADEIAFRRIIGAHHEDMRRVCLAISGDDAIAEEAVQAAWLVAWKKLDKVHGPDQLRPWLVSVAAREARQLLRKRYRRARIEVTAYPAGSHGGVDPATGVDSVDLRAALLRLDPDDRALLAMRYGAGLNSNELAIATGKSPAAIRQRLKRLVDRLREENRWQPFLARPDADGWTVLGEAEGVAPVGQPGRWFGQMAVTADGRLLADVDDGRQGAGWLPSHLAIFDLSGRLATLPNLDPSDGVASMAGAPDGTFWVVDEGIHIIDPEALAATE